MYPLPCEDSEEDDEAYLHEDHEGNVQGHSLRIAIRVIRHSDTGVSPLVFIN